MAIGRYGRVQFGLDALANTVANSGAATFAMAASGAGFAAAFMAADAQAVYGGWVNWSSASSPGTVQVSLETFSAGVPGGLGSYDANAQVSITPAAGWQQFTFATPPTTALVPGNLYALVLVTTGAGTTQTLRGYTSTANWPTEALSTATGGTRSSFAKISNSAAPIATLVLADGTESTGGLCPWATSAAYSVYLNRAAGMQFTPGGPISFRGYVISNLSIVGSPSSLNVAVRDASGGVVSGTATTVPTAQLQTATTRIWLPAAVTLQAGTYYVSIDQGNNGTAGNCYQMPAAIGRSASVIPSAFVGVSTTDITATPPAWTQGNGGLETPGVALILDDIPAAGGVGRSPRLRMMGG